MVLLKAWAGAPKNDSLGNEKKSVITYVIPSSFGNELLKWVSRLLHLLGLESHMEPVVLVDEVWMLSFKQVTTFSFDVYLLAGRLLAIASDCELQAIGKKTTVISFKFT